MLKCTELTYLNDLCPCLGSSGSARSCGSSRSEGKARIFRNSRGKRSQGSKRAKSQWVDNLLMYHL